MALRTALTCPCWPGKVFATAGSLRTHRLSQRHQPHEARLEIADLRAQLAQSVNARRALERTVQDLATQPRLRRVTESVKKRVAASQAWKCAACAEVLQATYQIDHRQPLWRGGSNEPDNLQALCPNCHAAKTQIEGGSGVAGVAGR